MSTQPNQTNRPYRSRGILGGLFSAVRFGEFMVASILILVAGFAFAPGYLRSAEQVAVARASDAMRRAALAVESYYVDHELYPPSGMAAGPNRNYRSELFWEAENLARIPGSVPTANSFAPPRSGAARLVTFRAPGPGYPTLHSITTPIAYLKQFPEDPFSRTPGASLGYFAHERNLGYLIFSLGPDRDENDPDGPGEISPQVERLYDLNEDFPHMWTPSEELLGLAYDPTNGLFSEGDLVWRLK